MPSHSKNDTFSIHKSRHECFSNWHANTSNSPLLTRKLSLDSIEMVEDISPEVSWWHYHCHHHFNFAQRQEYFSDIAYIHLRIVLLLPRDYGSWLTCLWCTALVRSQFPWHFSYFYKIHIINIKDQWQNY